VSKSRHYTIFWSKLAFEDLESITSYIALENPVYAYKVWQQIHAATERLSTLPLRCRIIPELKEIGVEVYREIIVDPYRIMIHVQNTSVWILGVFDGRRDFEEILMQRIFI
jgi:toxin ParE1/3/4